MIFSLPTKTPGKQRGDITVHGGWASKSKVLLCVLVRYSIAETGMRSYSVREALEISEQKLAILS